MTTHKTSIENETRIALPLPPKDALQAPEEIAVYACFMRHLRHVPHNRAEIRILSALQFTADMLDYGDAVVARMLVDLGLRAPRMAFPADFLKFVDQSFLRERGEVGAPTKAMIALRQHWQTHEDSKFSIVYGDYSVVKDSLFA